MTVTDTTPSLNGTTASSQSPDTAPGDKELLLLVLLVVLCFCFIRAVLAILVGIVVAIVPLNFVIPGFETVTQFVVDKKVGEAKAAGVLIIAIHPGEGFFTYLQVALLVGVAIAMPMIIYQVLAFVTPALYPSEKRYLYLAVPGVSLSFVVGIVFCYLLLLPAAIHFLGSFESGTFAQQWTAENYMDFVSCFMFWIGVIFELPLVMYFLSKLGVVSVQRMVKFRKYAFVLAFVIGAVITPTPDPFNQTIVSLPIYFLFELGIILARFA